MTSNVRNLSRVDSYEAALERWGETPLPRTRDGLWCDWQRPLGTVYQHHYRLEKTYDYFDVVLYQTVMARFHKPEGNERSVEYAGCCSRTSRAFLWHVLGTQTVMYMHTTDGTKVTVPLGIDRQLNTELTLVNGLIDVSRSTHPVMEVQRMSAECKARRKQMRKDLQVWLDAMVLRMPEFAKGEANEDAARPFASRLDGLLPGDMQEAHWLGLLHIVALAEYAWLWGRYGKHPDEVLFRKSLERKLVEDM